MAINEIFELVYICSVSYVIAICTKYLLTITIIEKQDVFLCICFIFNINILLIFIFVKRFILILIKDRRKDCKFSTISIYYVNIYIEILFQAEFCIN